MTTVLGVDACPAGWVGVELRDGRFVRAHVGTRLNELVEQVPDAAIIGVDMPLGLVECGERDADRVVKRKLAHRSSSLFMMPPRPVFDELSHPAASARCRVLTGKGLSIQAWGLKSKLLEANALYDEDALPLREVHPELSFSELGLLHDDGGKKSWRGQRARLRVLEAAGIYIPEDLGESGRKGFLQTMCLTLPPQHGPPIESRMTSLSAHPIRRSATTVDSRSPSGTDRDVKTRYQNTRTFEATRRGPSWR